MSRPFDGLEVNKMSIPRDEVLQKMEPGIEWYSEDVDGSIQIRTGYVRSGSKKARLSGSARFALAMTELCCERRSGKIYTFARHVTNDVTQGCFAALGAFQALPELFYVPCDWSADDQLKWKAMTPVDQLHCLSSRHGWVPKEMPVLPFALVLEEVLWHRPRIGGLSEALVTVLVSPKPYVGVTEDMRALCNRTWRSTSRDGVDRPIGTSFLGKELGWRSFQRWEVQGGGGILERLESFYREGIDGYEDPLMYYGVLERRLIQAGQRAAEVGLPYGISSPAVD